jgi:hypothetical protein
MAARAGRKSDNHTRRERSSEDKPKVVRKHRSE